MSTSMFTSTPNMKELRQGDILAATWYPRMKLDAIRLVAKVDHGEHASIVTTPEVENQWGTDWISAQTQMTRGYVMVLSHCCDLELTHGKPRGMSAVVSPLVPVAKKIWKSPEYLEAFRKNDPEGYINFFYVEQAPPLTSEMMVDFGRMASIVIDKEYEEHLKRKVLQMTDGYRMKLKDKLGLNFGRPTDEEIAAGLVPQSPKPAKETASLESVEPSTTTK